MDTDVPSESSKTPGEYFQQLSSQIPPNPSRRGSLRATQPAIVDIGYNLIVSVLADEEFESAQIWDALGASYLRNPYGRSVATFTIQSGPSWRSQTLQQWFPPLEEALSLAEVAFHVCYRVHEAVHKESFFEAIEILYDTSQEQNEFPYLDYCTLLAATIAIAYAMDGDRHEAIGCDVAKNNSQYYLMFARANLNTLESGFTSITQLKTAVLIMLFHLNADNVRSVLRLLSLACDSVSRLGLRDNTSMQSLYWTVLYLDSYICGFLKKPPFLDISTTKSATLAVMQQAASNQNRIVRSSLEFLLNVGLALSLELLDLQKRIASLELNDSQINKARKVPFTEIRKLEKELESFKAVSNAFFPTGEIVNVIARTRYELQMSLCVTSMMLVAQREWLLSIARVRFFPGDDTDTNTEKLSATNTAILAIDCTIDYIKLPGHAPVAEPSAYVLFISILCLTKEILITIDQDIRKQLAAKMLAGFFLMSRMACQAFAATPIYLRYIYDLGHQCGAIPDVAEHISSSPISHGHRQNEFNVDWNFLPGYQDFDHRLLSVPDLHNIAGSHITPTSTTTGTPSQAAASLSPQRRSSHIRLLSIPSSSQTSSRSSMPPSVFSQRSSELPYSTPSSSTRATPVYSWSSMVPDPAITTDLSKMEVDMADA